MNTLLSQPVRGLDHIRGPDYAPLTLVEYGDYQCPYSGRAHQVVQTLQRLLGNRLRFVYRHFPVVQLHPQGQAAAEVAEIAAQQDRFWVLHDLLFDNQHALNAEDLIGYAAMAGIGPGFALDALAQHRFADRVRQDYLSGIRSGVSGTPTFFINGVRHDAPWNEPALLAALEIAALRQRA